MTTLKSMEARLQAQSALHFLPYIGPEYGVAAPRIVMLGEAAPGPGGAEPELRPFRGAHRFGRERQGHEGRPLDPLRPQY